ncbi:Na(+)/H(+) antiporter NhaA [Stieleria neptunia]|uniref:Na(+)/H(+) antiporter NhaA n=1 Tax=Stieleria neptunia TaxID=2527979 RepID=A0A518HLL0_9BACT|nr:Na+/H+ antiporter NhaA [Stieleria neptunia]QDV41735.1 Na(+)/H(+) antiporter NhaA [Stieleria neptunia]
MSGHETSKGGVIRFLIDNSLLLVIGAVAALIWANLADRSGSSSYHDFIHYDVRNLWGGGEHHSPTPVSIDANAALPQAVESGQAASADGATTESTEHGEGEHGDESHADSGHHWYSLSFLINDVLMALFFAIAAKEVWESLLPGGALSNPRKAATPLLATFGGIVGPALFYLAGAYATGTQAELGQGWAVPCATDIAFSYLVARLIFGPGHPAIAFLLLLAIADDAAGLMILAIFYPSAPIEPIWLLLTAAAMALAWLLRKLKIHSHWFYMLGPGVLSWFSFYLAHIHPALGLVPIIPLLPSAVSDLGIFAKEELKRDDTLNEFEHFWKTPVECILGLFGLANAGVVLSSVGTGTWLVLAGLLVGKPVGITAMTLLAEKGFRLQKPAGMDYRHVVTLGMVAGIGFTVALFVSVAAFKIPGATQDSVKMGALLSFGAAPLAILIAKLLSIRPDSDDDEEEETESSAAA